MAEDILRQNVTASFTVQALKVTVYRLRNTEKVCLVAQSHRWPDCQVVHALAHCMPPVSSGDVRVAQLPMLAWFLSASVKKPIEVLVHPATAGSRLPGDHI